jgi:putative transposase
MSRYRLLPSPAHEVALRAHCAHARFVWNLAVEQHRHWRPGHKSAPGYLEQCRQLTAARAENPWLAAGSQMVQQQALRDFAQATANYFRGTHGRPPWRQASRDEGSQVVALRLSDMRRLRRLQRRLARARPGSNRRARVKLAMARLRFRRGRMSKWGGCNLTRPG